MAATGENKKVNGNRCKFYLSRNLFLGLWSF